MSDGDSEGDVTVCKDCTSELVTVCGDSSLNGEWWHSEGDSEGDSDGDSEGDSDGDGVVVVVELLTTAGIVVLVITDVAANTHTQYYY